MKLILATVFLAGTALAMGQVQVTTPHGVLTDDPALLLANPDFPAKASEVTTTVQDPANPEEPWIITTYKNKSESIRAFMRRHRMFVEAARDVIGE
jgi:hypothetical protein